MEFLPCKLLQSHSSQRALVYFHPTRTTAAFQPSSYLNKQQHLDNSQLQNMCFPDPQACYSPLSLLAQFPGFHIVLWGSGLGFPRLSSAIVMRTNVHALMVSEFLAPVLTSPMISVNYQPDMSWTPQIGYDQAELLKLASYRSLLHLFQSHQI